MTNPSTRTVSLRNGLTVTIDEYGDTKDGTGALILHGGAGPRSVAGFATTLSEHGYIVVPTHPGFDGTPRPDWADTVADLAMAYLDLIDELGLTSVMVLGSSFGGWIATEMGLFDNHARINSLVLLGAVGVTPEPPLEIADPARIGPVKTVELAFFNPALRPNPAALSDEQRAVSAANQRTQAIYAGGNQDPKLRGRLHRVAVPVLVLAGEHDGIVPLEYERAFADGFPRSTLRTVPEAGHFPHIEQPGIVLAALNEFVEKELAPSSE